MSDIHPPDEDRLLAYLDGELDPAAAAEVEALLARDAAAARYVAAQRALREQLQAAFRPTLDEAPPARLRIAAQSLAQGLDAKGAAGAAAPAPGPARESFWSALLGRPGRGAAPSGSGRFGGLGGGWAWAGAAASLLLGVLIGLRLPAGGDALLALEGGELRVGARLAQALESQLAAEAPADAPVRMGPSFVATDGPYCRSFVLAARDAAGLACRTPGGWELELLARAEPQSGAGYRQAASALPETVLAAIDARSAGETLDAEAERRAREQGWLPR